MIDITVTPNVCPDCLAAGVTVDCIGDWCGVCGHRFLSPSVVKIADTQTRAQRLAQGVKDALQENDIIGPSRLALETLLHDFDEGPVETMDYIKVQKYILMFDPDVTAPNTRDALDALQRLVHNT